MGKEIRTIYKEGQDKLAAGGVHDAAFDARALLSFVLEIPFREMPLHYMDEAADEQQALFDELIGRRLEGEPLQYITGEQEFMGLTFHVDSRVLIPRLDTEILADKALEYVNSRSDGSETFRVLDLCCGSGAIGLSIAALADTGKDAALANPETYASQIGDEAVAATDAARVEVVLSDISKDALEVARQNAEQLGISDRVTFVQGDLFDELGQGGFDLIVSNPPYIRTDVIETLDAEVKDHEPVLALDGGTDGLDIYRRIAEEAPGYLKEGGCLMMEIGFDQAEEVAELLKEGFDDVQVMKDLAGLDRIVSAKRK